MNGKIGYEQVELGTVMYPGRKVLCVGEVALGLGVTKQHVIDLIEEGVLGAIDVGGGGRKYWRVPVGEYERFVRRRVSK